MTNHADKLAEMGYVATSVDSIVEHLCRDVRPAPLRLVSAESVPGERARSQLRAMRFAVEAMAGNYPRRKGQTIADYCAEILTPHRLGAILPRLHEAWGAVQWHEAGGKVEAAPVRDFASADEAHEAQFSEAVSSRDRVHAFYAMSVEAQARCLRELSPNTEPAVRKLLMQAHERKKLAAA
jgi:hypothetical protein